MNLVSDSFQDGDYLKQAHVLSAAYAAHRRDDGAAGARVRASGK